MPSITISSIAIPNWQGNASGISLYIYVNSSFTAESGTAYPATVQSHLPHSGLASVGTFFLSFPCTVSGTTLTTPSVTLDSTLDSPDNPNATYSAVLWDTVAGQPIQTFGTASEFVVPASPTTTTWEALFPPSASTPVGLLTVGSVTELAPGSTPTATITGSKPYLLNLGVPQGQQGIQGTQGVQGEQGLQGIKGDQGVPGLSGNSLYPYADTTTGLAQTPAGNYFMIPSATVSAAYDVYQNVSGSAVLQQQLSGLVAQSDGGLLTIGADFQITLYAVDNTGKPYSVLYESRVAAVEQSVATLVASSPESGGTALLSLETQDWSLPLFDLNGNVVRPSTQIDPNAATSAAITAINAECLAYGRSVSSRFNLLGTGLEYDYNVIILDGQSLMSGFQATSVYSTTAKHGNCGLGQNSQWQNSAGNANPVEDNNFDPLIERVPESPASGCANMLKNYLNRATITTENGKTLVVTNMAAPGTTIEEHLPGAAPADNSGQNLWSRIQRLMQYLPAAVPAGKTIGVVAVWWGQGEFNVGNSAAQYTANLVTLRAAYDSLIAQAFPAQVRPAAWFITQIGGTYLSDNAPGVMHAELNYSFTTPHTYCVGSYYHIPNLVNGHRTGNGYRWLGTQGGRVMGETLVLRRGFEPVHPIKAQFVGNTILLGFHVPVGPLIAKPSYFNATPQNFADLGFSLFDKDGYVPCTVSIVESTVVQLVPYRPVDQATAQVRYADQGNSGGSPAHNGMGNLCDSNFGECEDVYAKPDQDSVAAGNNSAANGAPAGTNYDIPGLTTLPYPQNNFCVAFQLYPATFTGTF